MTKTALVVLSVGLVVALWLGIRTIFFTPGSTVTTTSAFQTQSVHQVAGKGTYVPFDSAYGLQGTQWSRGRSELIDDSLSDKN